MKLKFIFFILWIILNILIKNVYAEISIRAEVDKTSINSNETVTYKLIIVSDEKNIPPPKLPNFSGFSIISQNQSSTISIGKGKLNTKLLYIFVLAPLNIGKSIIEPSCIKIKNKSYCTESFEIEIKETPPSDSEPLLPEKPVYENRSLKVTL